MKSKLSRRAVSAALLGVPALAQAPQAKPQETPQTPKGEDLRAAASRNIKNTAARVREFSIAIETEPAFRFRV